jgi:hypothetical protein
VSADPFVELGRAARAYVDVVDAVEGTVGLEVFAALAAFFAAGAALPPVEPGDEDDGIRGVEARIAAERRLRVALGPLDEVLTVGWSPDDEYAAFRTSLAYGLAKVYDGALGVLAGESAWELRFGFWSDWGEYAARAQLALYSFYESRGPLNYPV